MFPNVRLMIVAVLASIMGISCALALFAEFRISRDSFLRESSGAAAPLQLSAGGPPPALINATATFGGRLEAPPPLPAVSVSLPRQEPAAPAAAAAPQTTAVSPAASPQTAPDGAPASETVASKSSNPVDSAQSPSPEGGLGSPQIPTATSAPPAGPSAQKPVEKPGDALAERTPAGAKPEPAGAVPDSKTAPQGAPAVAAKRRTTVRHRPLMVRRAVRPRQAAPAQTTFTATQSTYQWAAPGQFGQPAQPVRRRVIVRRTRAVRKSEQPAAGITNPTPTHSAVNAPM